VGFTVPADGRLTLSVSAPLSGAPVQIRMLDDGHVEGPSFVSFAPTGPNALFTHTFTAAVEKRRCGHTLSLQWRSPSEQTVVSGRGRVVVSFTPVANEATCVHG
jgi:hypothetical protein